MEAATPQKYIFKDALQTLQTKGFVFFKKTAVAL